MCPQTPSDPALFDGQSFDIALKGGTAPIALFRNALKEGDRTLAQRFTEGVSAADLVPRRAWLVDELLRRAWRLCEPSTEAALCAVGGYGRGELHPGSDVDIMVLLPEGGETAAEGLEQFITFLWDIGLEVGHSVRTLADCVRESEADITVATNLMESRLLAGKPALYQAMREDTGPARLWASRDFFRAKWEEQLARHAKYEDTAYNLEPNIKEGPGGLRDIQMVGWVAKRHFGAETLHDLVGHGFLTESEHQSLAKGQEYLWNVRFALHTLAGRREDRLLFDHQIRLAEQFGYQDQEHNLAVEQFMQRYFRVVMGLSRLNEMLLQLFQEAILYADDDEAPVVLNKRFQARRGFLEVTHSNVFKRYPFALLEVFLLMQQHPELKGVRASTIRLIRQYRNLVDARFRRDLRARSLFMEIMRQPQGITHEMRRMHRYGVLARYIPAFGQITGRMQYDLFHAYTVDSHTLMLLRNLRRFAIPKHAHEFPLCSTIMNRLPKPELLYLAALFHDIAKGRGGDHSVLGAEDAYTFCAEHGLSSYDARLVAWLVRNHLLMSMTAQRKDIADPQVINDFARQVGDHIHLDYLYLLTVSDIRSTNPSLWNSWKDSLLAELYSSTKRALRRGLGDPMGDQELIRETQTHARHRLRARGLHHMTVRSIWRRFTDDYFLRYSAEEIAWHTAAIAKARPQDLPLVLINPRGPRGGTEVFVYTRDVGHVFALTASTLDQLNLDIQDARIITTDGGYTLDSYLVLDEQGEPVTERGRVEEIALRLRDALQDTERLPQPSTRPLPRRLRHFRTATQLSFSNDVRSHHTVLELITGDRPGLLSRVGYAFTTCDIRLKNAKITTIGERAEDVFFITDDAGRPISDPRQFECLRGALDELLGGEGTQLTSQSGAHQPALPPTAEEGGDERTG
ncbi:[protein-PII] uridylyltransferase [Alkalilimnicola sp. S0819]|uniref:[protein-PII] uridylyltransferase n=1 Tax=Alkalilimnicola sp. S0819 TaxID=2613922 RepID=UPI00126294F0|nr:[protein-PII] uridylyltransferase [Alkalilimnicola sp. S0819]KAB7627914.1 [protein-PII] uridylyltransferase [Alkalilimnicola sp. S0819]MPQ15550.1 [protein-PII] uridylyltransferase [Alkalilimnicola sp. S0819]